MIKELFESGRQTLSFEVFPPKKDDEFENAFHILDSLSELSPDFISVTYGAGGSKSKRTVEIASYIQNTLHIPAIAHMTCVGSRKEDLSSVATSLKEANISHVLGKPLFDVPMALVWLAPLAGPVFFLLMTRVWYIGVKHYRSTGT